MQWDSQQLTADHQRAIALELGLLRNRRRVGGERLLLICAVDAVPERRAAAQQRGSGRGADRVPSVKAVKDDAARPGGPFVELRCTGRVRPEAAATGRGLHVLLVVSDVSPAHVVGQDHQEVRRRSGGGDGAPDQQQEYM
jgi:hypothetical protein